MHVDACIYGFSYKSLSMPKIFRIHCTDNYLNFCVSPVSQNKSTLISIFYQNDRQHHVQRTSLSHVGKSTEVCAYHTSMIISTFDDDRAKLQLLGYIVWNQRISIQYQNISTSRKGCFITFGEFHSPQHAKVISFLDAKQSIRRQTAEALGNQLVSVSIKEN